MNAAAIIALVLQGIELAGKAAPIVFQGVADAKPFAMDLWRKITGKEPTPEDELIIDARLAEMSARLMQPLPPAQPGDPDYVTPVG